MARDLFNQRSLGQPLNVMVKEARILMVGAGGIGCELLKNLVLTGFGEIHIVDLDTIDLSNLNRQFLFRHEHIKKSKALVAKEAAHRFNPSVKLEAHHSNIKEAQFDVEWFKSFTIVFNALDNMDARRHVNKMCLAADVPLIESGTTGFNGQVQVIKKGVTACYDCTTKETPKSFPVCTIRSTPSQPIHCIVWGKSYLMSEIFGTSEDEAPQLDHSEDSENAREIAELRRESQALKQIKESIGSVSFAQKLFDKVFRDDIMRLRSMEEMWKSRRPPEPLEFEKLAAGALGAKERKVEILKDSQRVWTLEENLVVFHESLEMLSKRMEDLQSKQGENGPAPTIDFDKDDEDTLNFVTASANIRSLIFGIEPKSKFDTKQMAGNIIPAIATTNAIVAGLCVLQSFKVLKGEYSNTKEVFLSPFTPERLLSSDRMGPPNPDCPVCSVAQTRIEVDVEKTTLKDLVEDFLRSDLGYAEELVVNLDTNLLYDVEETDNLDSTLSALGVTYGNFLTIVDEEDDNPRVNLLLNVKKPTSDSTKAITALDLKPSSEGESTGSGIPRRPKLPPQVNGHTEATTNGTNGTNGINGHKVEAIDFATSGKKRTAAEALDDDGSTLKKAKVSGNDFITIADDPHNGAIVIDDD